MVLWGTFVFIPNSDMVWFWTSALIWDKSLTRSLPAMFEDNKEIDFF